MEQKRANENYIEIKRQFLAEGQRFVLVSVQGQRGFDPSINADLPYREGKLIVDADGSLHGATQNNKLDEKIHQHALVCLAAKRSESLMIGSANVTFEYVAPRPKLVIIGANSVGLAISRAASGLDFKVVLIDDDDGEQAGEGDACGAVSSKLESVQFDEATYIVVAHPLGYIHAIEYCLKKPWAYCGVLGARSKIEEFWENLRSSGVSDTLRTKIHAPLGFDIGARTPEEIAIAALAEIIAVKNGKLLQ